MGTFEIGAPVLKTGVEKTFVLKPEMGLGFEEPGGRPHQEFPGELPRARHPRYPTINGG